MSPGYIMNQNRNIKRYFHEHSLSIACGKQEKLRFATVSHTVGLMSFSWAKNIVSRSLGKICRFPWLSVDQQLWPNLDLQRIFPSSFSVHQAGFSRLSLSSQTDTIDPNLPVPETPDWCSAILQNHREYRIFESRIETKMPRWRWFVVMSAAFLKP